MLRPLKAGIRLGGIIIALALVLQFMQPNRAFAQGITLTPSANPPMPGTSVRVDGTGFAAGETITIKFAGTAVGTTPATITTSNPGGSFSGAYFTIPSGASNGPHTVTAVGSKGDHASATLVVGPTTPAGPVLGITKTVDNYSCGPGQCAANVGEVLNYQLSVSNNGGPTATGVIVTDTLQAGQAFLDATASAGTCSATNNGDGTTTVSCSIGTLNGLGSAGSTATVVIRAQVTGSTSTISNIGYVGAGTGTTSASNTTTVSVVGGGNYPCTTSCTNPCTNYPCTNPCYPYAAGTCNQCPACNACGYNNCFPSGCGCNPCSGTSCNPCGAYSCSPCGAYGCNPYPTGCGTCNPTPCQYSCNTCGCNPCGTTCNPTPCQYSCNTCGCNPCGTTCNPAPCQYSCNSCSAACVTPYYGTSTYCGVVTGYNPAGYGSTGTIYMNGNTYVVASGTSFPGVTVTPGQYYCFIYGSNQYITGCLSILPVGIDDGGPVKIGRELFY